MEALSSGPVVDGERYPNVLHHLSRTWSRGAG